MQVDERDYDRALERTAAVWEAGEVIGWQKLVHTSRLFRDNSPETQRLKGEAVLSRMVADGYLEKGRKPGLFVVSADFKGLFAERLAAVRRGLPQPPPPPPRPRPSPPPATPSTVDNQYDALLEFVRLDAHDLIRRLLAWVPKEARRAFLEQLLAELPPDA